MIYNPLEKKETEYQGESFSSNLGRGFAWEATDSGYYELLDDTEVVLSTGATTLAGDLMTLDFLVPKADTATLEGKHRVLIHLTNTLDATVDDVIADYTIIYKIKKA